MDCTTRETTVLRKAGFHKKSKRDIKMSYICNVILNKLARMDTHVT